MPIFHEGELIGWVGGVTHVIDTGSVGPGSMSTGQVQRFGDGYSITCRKIGENAGYRRGLIVSDGVFSMDGDIAPLDKLVEVAEEFGLILMVDDAHGEGVLGRGGRGIVDHFGLHGRVHIEVGTLSKAFGVVGGLVAGRKPIIDWLRQRGRPFLFSSAMTAPDVAACARFVVFAGARSASKRRSSAASTM